MSYVIPILMRWEKKTIGVFLIHPMGEVFTNAA